MKRDMLWRWLLAFGLALAVTVACRKFFLMEGVEVFFVAQTSVPVTYQVKFHGANGVFCDALSVQQESARLDEDERLSFLLPIKETAGIQLMLRSDDTSGVVRVRALSINGRPVDVSEVLRQGVTEGTEKSGAEDGSVCFTLRAPLASFTLPEEMSRVRSQRRYDILPLFSVFMMSCLLLVGAVDWMVPRLSGWRDCMSAVFLLTIGLIFIIPVLRLRLEDVSVAENRHLSPLRGRFRMAAA